MSRLFVAEKPSVAESVAKVIDPKARKTSTHWVTASGDLITWAFGHLVELIEPDEYDSKFKSWAYHLLPIIPETFRIKPTGSDAARRLSEISAIIKKEQPSEIVNSCDAGREGELIFRRIYQQLRLKLPMTRLYLQSMTTGGIQTALQGMKPGSNYDDLADAARARSEADWLVGINGTRAATKSIHHPSTQSANAAPAPKKKGKKVTKVSSVWSVGRVQTPTLAIIVDRELKIQDFKPKTFYTVEATFALAAQSYTGMWYDPQYKADPTDPDHKADRLKTKAAADAIQARVLGQPAVISESVATKKENAPHLFDLNALSQEANKLWGWTATHTLKIAQDLYESKKALTYPRTDAKALPEDYPDECQRIMGELAKQGFGHLTQMANSPKSRAKDKAIFNDAKISDHFAIIPTGEGLSSPTTEERNLYQLVVMRFIAVFCDPCEKAVKERTTIVQNPETDHFSSQSTEVVKPGWRGVYGTKVGECKPLPLPGKNGDKTKVTNATSKTGQTTPPPRYTEATLLKAMEFAGKLVDDDALADAMKERGLGTPATRGSIIDRLKNVGTIDVTGKTLIPTEKGIHLILELRKQNLNGITSPELTGDWEFKLKQIEKGKLSYRSFIQEIIDYTNEIVVQLKPAHVSEPTEWEEACPICGSPLQEGEYAVECEKYEYNNPKACQFRLPKLLCQHSLTKEEMVALITQKKTDMILGFVSKKNRPFNAKLKLTDEGKIEFEF